jgi:hypothetical protein
MFELIGAPSRGLGIPMRELVVRSGGALERMIVDANERIGSLMSSSPRIRKVSLRIMVRFAISLFPRVAFLKDALFQWPGYDHVDWSHSLDLFSSAGPVTRGQLAVQIAFAFATYMTVSPCHFLFISGLFHGIDVSFSKRRLKHALGVLQTGVSGAVALEASRLSGWY